MLQHSYTRTLNIIRKTVILVVKNIYYQSNCTFVLPKIDLSLNSLPPPPPPKKRCLVPPLYNPPNYNHSTTTVTCYYSTCGLLAYTTKHRALIENVHRRARREIADLTLFFKCRSGLIPTDVHEPLYKYF